MGRHEIESGENDLDSRLTFMRMYDPIVVSSWCVRPSANGDGSSVMLPRSSSDEFGSSLTTRTLVSSSMVDSVRSSSDVSRPAQALPWSAMALRRSTTCARRKCSSTFCFRRHFRLAALILSWRSRETLAFFVSLGHLGEMCCLPLASVGGSDESDVEAESAGGGSICMKSCGCMGAVLLLLWWCRCCSDAWR
ncbi:hypothetical protein SPRG_19583 [Saprolegnia parasitica CBS 223.65]|uniref:Uncharacterized protein n=1 Tax=Saprolegnia parasitica (strain CBS 223.65) TaxID=695850 RepID=A0A067CP84_SAPPC|nr:hypothetical protein SPRG_19583 [Saprolegnia parasitica CBS 223.65]KDO31055.1 hypothetical protein SPRG_19583 [Saprolegnia parasitica CBS 223.65]|eukprot:XP_012198316.1 hypothetical protein SPRG_19583 [Saprolegnia parasitica CBS 223.65]